MYLCLTMRMLLTAYPFFFLLSFRWHSMTANDVIRPPYGAIFSLLPVVVLKNGYQRILKGVQLSWLLQAGQVSNTRPDYLIITYGD